ncbi:MAG: HEPN domain-containing protein [bacterium]
MKQTTKDWLTFAEEDLLAAKTLAQEERLTSLVAFHCQQCVEKCFKAMIEEQDKPSIRSHDLLRLQQYATIELSVSETALLGIINEVYIDARYPGDLGLLPNGKPTISEAAGFIALCETILYRLEHQIE